jgi:ketosteroid isomerase-like protein
MNATLNALVRRAYDAFARGDVPGVVDCVAEDVECVLSDETPYGGVWRGRDGLARGLEGLCGHYEELVIEVSELVGDGETVVVLGHLHGRALGGGNLWQPFAHVVRVRDGRITHLTSYADATKPLRALGLFPAPPLEDG